MMTIFNIATQSFQLPSQDHQLYQVPTLFSDSTMRICSYPGPFSLVASKGDIRCTPLNIELEQEFSEFLQVRTI